MSRPFTVVAAAGTVLILASCSLPSVAPAETDVPSDPPVSVPLPSGGPQTGLPTPAAATPSETPTQAVGEESVASRPGSIDKVRVTAQVFPVRRSGGTATIDLYIASRDPEKTFMLSDNLGDGNTETSSSSLTSVDGIRLLDTTAKKAYLAAVTADGACVCSPDDASTATFNASVWVSVTFARPTGRRHHHERVRADVRNVHRCPRPLTPPAVPGTGRVSPQPSLSPSSVSSGRRPPPLYPPG